MNHRNDWNQDQTLRYQDIPIGELQQKPVSYPFTRFKFQHRLFSSRILQPVDYLLLVEPYIAKELISRKNYAEIKQLADQFTGGITSFFGFETRLNSLDARSDYLFAVSSKKGEREALANLLQNGGLSQRFLQKSEWQHVKDFVLSWVDPKSILYDNVLGLWFEFDTAKSFSETPIPSIFVQTSLSCIKDYHDYQKYSWITQIALPILTGSPTLPITQFF